MGYFFALLLFAFPLVGNAYITLAGSNNEPFAPAITPPKPDAFRYSENDHYQRVNTQQDQQKEDEKNTIGYREWEPKQVYQDEINLNRYTVFGGLSYVNYLDGTQNNTFAVTNIETDSLYQTDQNVSVGAALGFQKVHTFKNPQADIHSLGYGMSFFYDPVSFTGQVYQYKSALLNNYTYQYSVHPLSSIAEVEATFIAFPKTHIAPFILAGFGFTLASLTYNETALSGVPAGIQANNANSWVITPDLALGAGIQFDFDKDYFLKTQYMYQYRGNADTKVNGFTGTVPVNLDEQNVAVLLGYRFR